MDTDTDARAGTGGGFFLWSGSVAPGGETQDNYNGAGLEIHDGNTGANESFFKFRTDDADNDNNSTFDEEFDPNRPSLEGVLTDASVNQLNNLIVGIESGMRGGVAGQTTHTGTMARELYKFDADPRNARYR